MKKNLVMLVLLVGSVQLGASGKSGALGSRHTACVRYVKPCQCCPRGRVQTITSKPTNSAAMQGSRSDN